MILGIGSDLVDIRRIQKSIDRFGDHFIDRIFTEVEKAKSDRVKLRAASYAKRFAAKEACSKALSTGVAGGVFWRDMGVVNDAGGKPVMQLTNGAARRLAAMTPPGHSSVVHLTITDEFPMAQAFVIIEAMPLPGAATS